MGFVSSLLGFANKIGGAANKWAKYGGTIGRIASGVSKAANLVSSVVPKVMPVVNAVTTGAKLVYQTGLADKLTNGKATRFVKGVQNMFTPNKGIQQNSAAIVRQVGATTGSKEMAKIM